MTPTYAALLPNSDNTVTLLVLRDRDCQPEERAFTSAGFTDGGAGQWLRQYVKEAQVIPYASFIGLVRYRAELCATDTTLHT